MRPHLGLWTSLPLAGRYATVFSDHPRDPANLPSLLTEAPSPIAGPEYSDRHRLIVFLVCSPATEVHLLRILASQPPSLLCYPEVRGVGRLASRIPSSFRNQMVVSDARLFRPRVLRVVRHASPASSDTFCTVSYPTHRGSRRPRPSH